MEAAGIEPASGEDASDSLASSCENQQAPRAALALQCSDSNCPELSSADNDLRFLIEIWSDHGISALAFAALYHHFEVFSMKQIKLQIDHPAMQDVLNYCCEGEGLPIVERLLAKGMNPNNQENGGCAAIQQLLDRLEWCSWSVYGWERRANGIDCSKSRDHLKAIHLLAKYGGKWRPVDSRQVNAARRSLLKMTPDYTIEFVWIMAKFQASLKSDIEALVRTPTMKRHLAPRSGRLAELLSGLPTDSPSEVENNPESGTVAE